MGRIKGKDGDVEVDGVSVAERINFSVETSTSTADASTQGDDWTDTEGLLKSASVELEVFTDPSNAQQQALVAGSTAALTLFPGGDAATLRRIAGNFLVERVGTSSAVDDLVKTSYTMKNQGEVTDTVIA